MTVSRIGSGSVNEDLARKLVAKYNEVLRQRGLEALTVDYDAIEPTVKRLVTKLACEGYRHYRANGRHRN